MTVPSLVRATALAGLALCLAGCAGGPARRPAGGDASAPRAVTGPGEASGLPADLPFEDRVEASARFASGLSLELNDRTEPALEEYHRSVLADPSHEALALEVARRLILSGRLEDAVELLRQSAQRPAAGGPIHALLGQAYAQQGKDALAIAANRAAIERMPRSLVGYQNLVALHLKANQPGEALAVLNQAAAREDVSAVFLVDLAELITRYGQAQPKEADAMKPRAIECLDRAAEKQPGSLGVLLKLADGYRLLGETTKAARCYLQLLERSPGMPTIREKLTELYLRGGETQAAAEQLKAIVRDNPTNPQAHYFLGSIAYDRRDYAEAAEYFGRALLLDPNYPAVYYDLAGLKITMNQPQEALRLVDKARELFNRNFMTEFYAGLAHGRMKNYGEAVKHLTDAELLARAGETNRLTHAFYFQCGASHERNKDYEQAEKYFRLSLELAPESAETLNYLGYMWADLGINLEEARRLIEKAVRLEPKNAAYLDSLGWVLFKLGESREALSRVLQAVELAEQPDPTLFEHLGDIYLALNEPQKAVEAWRKSLDVEDNEAIRRKLRNLSRRKDAGP